MNRPLLRICYLFIVGDNCSSSRADTAHQAARTRTPGNAPVLSPFSNVTWPFTIIQR